MYLICTLNNHTALSLVDIDFSGCMNFRSIILDKVGITRPVDKSLILRGYSLNLMNVEILAELNKGIKTVSF